MYLCYRCLHLSSLTFDLVEILLCGLIILGFAAIIEHHTTAKKAKEQPDKLIIPSPLAIVGGMLSWVLYAGVLLYGCFHVAYSLNDSFQVNPIFELVMGVIIFIISLFPATKSKKRKKSIFDPFGYLNE